MRKEPVRSKEITYVGLDANQETIHAGILLPGSGESMLESFPNTPDGIRRFIRRLKKRARGAIECCYEADPHQAPYAEAVGHLCCFRGIDTLTALSILAELHDLRRFASPRALMACNLRAAVHSTRTP